MTTLPIIELRRIRLSVRSSRETYSYTASLFADGRHVCDVSNDGGGGCDRIDRPGKGLTARDARKQYDDLAKIVEQRFPRQNLADDGEPERMTSDSLEYLCARLVADEQLLKEMRLDLKRNLLFCADGLPPGSAPVEIRMIRIDGDVARLAERLRLRHPKAFVLNEIAEADALAVYKRIA